MGRLGRLGRLGGLAWAGSGNGSVCHERRLLGAGAPQRSSSRFLSSRKRSQVEVVEVVVEEVVVEMEVVEVVEEKVVVEVEVVVEETVAVGGGGGGGTYEP